MAPYVNLIPNLQRVIHQTHQTPHKDTSYIPHDGSEMIDPQIHAFELFGHPFGEFHCYNFQLQNIYK